MLNKFLIDIFLVLQLESHTEPWHDLVYGPISYDVAKIEGDPVSSCRFFKLLFKAGPLVILLDLGFQYFYFILKLFN